MKKRFLFFSIILIIAVSQLYSQKKTFTCIDENGKALFYFESNYVRPYSEGLALFKTFTTKDDNNIWIAGFINEKGEIVIPPVFDSKDISKYGFRDGVSWVKLHNEKNFSLIDRTGKVLTQKKYDNVERFKNGLCAVYIDDKMGFVNTRGIEIIPCEYIGDREFHDGLVFVARADDPEKKYGFLNLSGNIAIPFIYQKMDNSRFSNGECIVKKDDAINLINTKGEIIFTLNASDNMNPFSCGLSLCRAKNEKRTYGYINKQNEWVIQPVYDKALSFENDLAIVSKNKKYGVINTNGIEIIPISYDRISKVNEIYSCINGNNKTYYDLQGKKISSNNIQYIKSKGYGNYHPYRDIYNKWGYLNKDGSVHIHAQYDFVEPFSEGKAWVY